MPGDDRRADAPTEIGASAETESRAPKPRDSKPVMLPAPGYDFGSLIGAGGMGEVVSARDRRIGRDVAIKRMRAANPSDEAVVRFLREARIQARLDHPAIVPVHELGVDDDGRPYFTMKRLAGVTLGQRISEGWPVNRLLRAFVDVCLAVEFAHHRGVVHRDLKPANIMLGDYGEVYVLDWGIARLTTDSVETPADATNVETLEGTMTGELLGTPGYMAPEQVRGQVAGAKTDVYALGAVLFEILTGELLHPRGTAGLATTLSRPQQSPQQRLPDENIAPELDVACTSALAELPEQRPTAGELGERLQKYLDGDRDVERRRALAKGELANARAAYESQDPEQRGNAMRSAGRALALDPQSSDAATLVASLMVEPTKAMPKELVVELQTSDVEEAKRRRRISGGALLSVLALVIVLPWLSVRSWLTLGLMLGALVVCSLTIWLSSRGNRMVGPRRVLIITMVVSVAFTRVLGPFMMTPIVTAGCLFAMCVNPWIRARRVVVYAWLVVATMLPLVLEWSGIFRQSVNLADGGLCAVSPIFRGQGAADAVVVIAANFLLLVTMANFAIATNREVTAARHEIRAQAWHLGQLLPTKIR